jgi:hypothetical protein
VKRLTNHCACASDQCVMAKTGNAPSGLYCRATPAAEDMYVADAKHPNCPYCGGSGHADDVTPQELDALRRRFVAALATPAAAAEPSIEAVIRYLRVQGEHGAADRLQARLDRRPSAAYSPKP